MEEIFECDACHRRFKSSKSLTSHYRFCKVGTHVTKRQKKSKYKIVDGLYKCECGREFNNYQSLNAHFCWCMVHKRACGLKEEIAPRKHRAKAKCNFSKAYLGEEEFKALHKCVGKILSQNIKSGKTIPAWKGKHHSEETKKKLRVAAVEYLENTIGSRPRYNKSSIPILEAIAKEHGWNIQHAENGGEFYTGIGYFVDAYDKEKNIVLEFDEPAHYVDAANNVLREKDVIRQNNIIAHLHCEFWRFNAVTQKLWKVNNVKT